MAKEMVSAIPAILMLFGALKIWPNFLALLLILTCLMDEFPWKVRVAEKFLKTLLKYASLSPTVIEKWNFA